MQRPPSSSRGPNNEHCVIHITQQPPQAKHGPKKMFQGSGTDLPSSVYIKRTREMSQPRPAAEKWVHAIPVIVFLCLFILWWFSYPVNLEIKDGRIVAIHRVENMPMPLSINDTHVELTILASATSPIASIPQNFTRKYNVTEAHPVSEPC